MAFNWRQNDIISTNAETTPERRWNDIRTTLKRHLSGQRAEVIPDGNVGRVEGEDDAWKE